MTKIPEGYPSSCKSNKIKSIVRKHIEEFNDIDLEESSIQKINKRSQLEAIIQLGIVELQSRQSKLITCLSAIGTILSLIIAGLALYISFNTSKSSTHWEKEQLEILGSINNSISASSTNIIKSLSNKLDINQNIMVESSNNVIKAIDTLEKKAANKAIKTDRNRPR